MNLAPPLNSLSLFVIFTLLMACPLRLPAQQANSLQEAVERVQRDSDGKILSAETVRQGRVAVYRIKVLTRDGRVHVVTVPAADRGRDIDRSVDGRRGADPGIDRTRKESFMRARDNDAENDSDKNRKDKED